MAKVSPIDQRKSDHIKINLEKDVRSAIKTGLDDLHFIHQALPEISLDSVDPSVKIFGKTLNAPILISSMTGGTQAAELINLHLAEAAHEVGVAMGVGSQRAALEQFELRRSFQVRRVAPDILLFANLGAVQLNYGYGIDECQRAVDMIQADALILHLNPLQEALQAGGDTNFSGLAKKIEIVCKALPVPVIVKEVGWGISERTARILISCGVSAIDVAGAGGTSWSQVEMHRAPDAFMRELASSFINWGIPTVDSIRNVQRVTENILVFASGGLRNGLDIAKCLALGAKLGGMAGIFLKSAADSTVKVIEALKFTKKQIEITMFSTGIQTIEDFSPSVLCKTRTNE